MLPSDIYRKRINTTKLNFSTSKSCAMRNSKKDIGMSCSMFEKILFNYIVLY